MKIKFSVISNEVNLNKSQIFTKNIKKLLTLLFVTLTISTMVSCSEIEKKDILIVCTSDIHGSVGNVPENEEDKVLRLSNIAAYVKDKKAEGKEVLLVDAGDHMQGSPYASYDNGAGIVDLMNATGYNLAVVGNHEFDYGMNQLNENISKAKFTYISSNFKKMELEFWMHQKHLKLVVYQLVLLE